MAYPYDNENDNLLLQMLRPYARVVEPIYGAAEAGTSLLSSLGSMVAGAPLSGGDDQRYMDFMRDYTYEPRSQTGKSLMGMLGSAGEFATDTLKLPPVFPGMAQFNALTANPAAIASQTSRLAAQGGQAINAAKPAIGAAIENAMARQGLINYAVPPSTTGAAQAANTLDDAQMAAAFARKAEREANLAKKVSAAAKKEKPQKEKVTKQAKQEADAFRAMEKELGQNAVLSAVNKGQHLKPDGRGGYIGAPRTVSSPQALGALRNSLDSQFVDGIDILNTSDPSRLGTWYDRAKAAQLLTNETYQLRPSLGQHAVYSAGVSPESELGFSLKHGVSRALGKPDMAYRSAPMNNLDKATAAGTDPKLGFKIGEYYNKNDPNQPNTGLFGVNDFRAAQGFGYTTPAGDIWTGGASATMHPFMDAETALAVQRANIANIGGRADWQGPHLQEVPWVLGKAQDLYKRGKGKTGKYNAKKFDGNEANAMKSAIRDANNTFENYLYKHAASATHESTPGMSTGHVSQMLNASDAEKAAYAQAGSWNLMDQLGEPKDALYSAVGLRQLPELPSSGAYKNSAGQFETNPMTIARPLLDFPTGGGGGRVDPTRSSMMNAVEQMRAAVDAQEAGAWNLPNSMQSVKGKNSMLIDSRQTPGGTATSGAQPSSQSLIDANNLLNNTDYGVTSTSNGVLIFPYDASKTPKDLAAVIKEHGKKLNEMFPGSINKSVASSGYVPGIGKWGKKDIVPTKPFSGEATAGLLQSMADAPAEVARKVSESEGVRAAIRRIIKRDASAGNARADIQEMRKFLSSSDWNKAVEMIRSGVKPAAAVAALGYSLSSMAAED